VKGRELAAHEIHVKRYRHVFSVAGSACGAWAAPCRTPGESHITAGPAPPPLVLRSALPAPALIETARRDEIRLKNRQKSGR